MKSKVDEWRTEEGLVRIRGWARDGLTDAHIAEQIGIHRATLIEWKKRYSDIADALKKGKDVADREIEEALFKKAKGFSVKVTKAIKLKNITYDEKTGRKISEEEYIGYAQEDVYVPPDTTAQIFWLKNRKPAEWRDKRDEAQEVSTEAAGVIEIPMVEVANE